MNATEYEKLIAEIHTKLRNTMSDKYTIKTGLTNLWLGSSGYKHQIDVSVETDTDIFLIECKCFGSINPDTENRLTAINFLTHWARLLDIKEHPSNKGKNVRAALATTKMWQEGVSVLVDAYKDSCSVFQVSDTGEVIKMIHYHFVTPDSIENISIISPVSITLTV